jgi:hypothetical protein
MPEETGCQLWGIIGRFLTNKETTNKEQDAIKRRFFGYLDVMEQYEYTIQDIQQLTGPEEIKRLINELEPEDLANIFY